MRHVAIGVLIFCGFCPVLVRAQSVAAGAEFQVNTDTQGSQIAPAIAMNAFGDFIVVWYGDGPGDGPFGIFGQRYDRSGSPLGGEFLVNTYTTYTQRDPQVAMDAIGNFAVVWSSASQDGDGYGVFGQRFDVAGNKQGPEFQVNTSTAGQQRSPKIAADAAGNFVVVWNSDNAQDGDGQGVIAQRFFSTGNRRGAEFTVNSFTTGNQAYPSISADPAGNFAVVWQSYGQDGSGYGVFGQRFDNAGARRGGEFQVSTTTLDDQLHPSVTVDATGELVVVWAGGSAGTGFGFFGQRFDSAGLPNGTEFQIGSYTTEPAAYSSLSSDASGNFVVTWHEPGRDGDGLGVVGQQFDSAALKAGLEFQVNSFTTGNQVYPGVVMDRKGNFVVAWQSYAQDGSDYGVFAQRFNCTDVDGDGICDLQDVIVTAPVEMATVDCLTPLTGRPTIEWDAGDFDRFRVFVGSDPNFAVGTKISSGKTLLRQSYYTVPAKKWKSACQKALTASPLSPELFIKIFGVNIDVPKSASNRKTFSQTVQVDVAH